MKILKLFLSYLIWALVIGGCTLLLAQVARYEQETGNEVRISLNEGSKLGVVYVDESQKSSVVVVAYSYGYYELLVGGNTVTGWGDSVSVFVVDPGDTLEVKKASGSVHIVFLENKPINVAIEHEFGSLHSLSSLFLVLGIALEAIWLGYFLVSVSESGKQ